MACSEQNTGTQVDLCALSHCCYLLTGSHRASSWEIHTQELIAEFGPHEGGGEAAPVANPERALLEEQQ